MKYSKITLKELPAEEHSRAELTIKMKDGQEFTKFTDAPEHGLVGRDEIKAKFMDQVAFSKTVTPENAEKIIKLLEKLEEIDNINQIIQLMVAAKT